MQSWPSSNRFTGNADTCARSAPNVVPAMADSVPPIKPHAQAGTSALDQCLHIVTRFDIERDCVVVVVVISEADSRSLDVYVNKRLRTNWQEPSSTHRCECSRARKLALNSGTTGGARKMASIPPKKPLHRQSNHHFHRPHNRHTKNRGETPICRCLITGTSTSMHTCRWTQRACQRPCPRTRRTTSLHEHRDVHNRR